MRQTQSPNTDANCSPVFSIAGVMPAASEMRWTTAYPNPDAHMANTRPAGHAVSFSVAGVMPGCAETAWRTSMPDPTRDVLDSHGLVITKLEAAARAELAHSRRAALQPVTPERGA